ncbi:MAG: ABC transporter permease [Haloferacaceae archaeon]
MSLRHRLGGHVPVFVAAFRNISRAKLRSALAAAAILIGVVSIAVVGAGGEAFKQGQLQRVEDRGATNVYVLPGPDNEQSQFTREDLIEIQETVGAVGVVATTTRDGEWHRRSDRTEEISLNYVESAAALRATETVARGELPATWRQQAVVSTRFASDHDLVPGDRLQISQGDGPVRTYRVVAVLAESPGFGGAEVYLPVRALDDRRYDRIRVLTSSADQAQTAADLLREKFNERRDRLLVFELTSLLRLFRQVVNGINTFLVGVGAISLVVAGVAIANTMLMAVIRRREEIGVLRAVGYSRGDVVRILLVEAGLLGVAGATAGLVLAFPVVLFANSVFLDGPFAFTPGAVGYLVAAFGFGVGVSLVAGAYPAWRAANERPVEALRG